MPRSSGPPPSARAPRARAARARRRPATNDELAHDLGVEGHAALGDPAHGFDEVADVAHSLLEQVADSADAVGEQLRRVGVLDVLREHQHREPGTASPRLDRRAQALVPERGWEPHVDDGDVRPLDDARAADPSRPRRRRRPSSPPPRAAARGLPAGGRDPPRSRHAWNLRAHDRWTAGGAGGEDPVQRRDTVTRDPRGRCRWRGRRRPHPSSTSTTTRSPCRPEWTPRAGVAVLADVDDRLGDDEVRGHLDRGGKAIAEADVEGDRDAARGDEAEIAASRPRSVSTAGAMPATSAGAPRSPSRPRGGPTPPARAPAPDRRRAAPARGRDPS